MHIVLQRITYDDNAIFLQNCLSSYIRGKKRVHLICQCNVLQFLISSCFLKAVKRCCNTQLIVRDKNLGEHISIPNLVWDRDESR